jgi:hypothetical protein
MNELVKKEETNVALAEDCFGAVDDVESGDLSLGLIKALSSNSKPVEQNLAKPGDIVDYDSAQKYGDPTTPVEVIILKMFRYWHEEDKDEKVLDRYRGKNKWELPWEMPNGGRRTFCCDLLVLPVADIEAGFEVPAKVEFKRTSLQGYVENLPNVLVKMKGRGIRSWDKKFVLSSKEIKGKKNSWYILELSMGGDTNDKEKEAAKKWFSMVKDYDLIKEGLKSNEVEDNGY